MKRKSFAAVTSQQVAQLAGVSQSAVSRSFTPGASISPATREKVLKAARELGYRPNAIARSLNTARSRIIGVVISYFDNQFYPQALEALPRGECRSDFRSDHAVPGRWHCSGIGYAIAGSFRRVPGGRDPGGTV
jgi:hypothetical protein